MSSTPADPDRFPEGARVVVRRKHPAWSHLAGQAGVVSESPDPECHRRAGLCNVRYDFDGLVRLEFVADLEEVGPR